MALLATLGACAATPAPMQREPVTLTPQPVPPGSGWLDGRVVRVVDGDSLVVQLASGPIEVRLHAADAPEYDQPGGREAQRALSSRLTRGTTVTLEPVSQDHYERMVAVVRLGEENVDAWLVRQGHAWAYRRFASDRRYCEWEEEARSAGRGLWAGSRPLVAPWDWRRTRRDPEFNPKDRSAETLADCLGALRQRR